MSTQLLKLILKTKPKPPLSARVWYYKNHNLPINADSSKIWSGLDEEKRKHYESCAVLDRKRFTLERDAWLTKLLTADLQADSFNDEDFRVEVKCATSWNDENLVAVSKGLDPLKLKMRRPRGPFSLWIEAYRYKIRDEKPEFQFGRHLRESAESWAALTEQEKQVYRDASKELWRSYREMLANEAKNNPQTCLSLDTLKRNRPTSDGDGPCRPSHLMPRLLSAKALWAKASKVADSERDSLWDSLPVSEKEIYQKEHERLDSERKRVKAKLAQIKKLIREAQQLESDERRKKR